MNEITLDKPILVDGESTYKLKVTPATFKDFVAFSKPIAEKDPFSKSLNVLWRNPTEFEVSLRMIEKMANLSPMDTALLSMETAMTIVEKLTPFMGSLPEVMTGTTSA